MKRWALIVGILVAAGLAVVMWYRATALTVVSREIPMHGIESVQTGGDVTLVQDGQDKLVIRTTRRAMPWAMARKEGTFLQLGWPDDADPRMFAGMLGLTEPDDDLKFELHSSTARSFTVTVGSTLGARSITGNEFHVLFMAREPMTLSGIDVDTLKIDTDGDAATLTLVGRAGRLEAMNSAGVTIDASRLKVGDTAISGGGSTTVDLEGVGVTTLTGAP